MITEKVSGGQSFLASIQNLLIFAIFKSSLNLDPIRHWSENWCPDYLEHALCSSEIHLAAAKSLEIIGHVTNCCKRPIPPELEGLKLADTPSGNSEVDILIGNDQYGHLITGKMIKTSNEAMIAIESKFGWLLAGSTSNIRNSNTMGCHRIDTQSAESQLDSILTKFWETNQIPNERNQDDSVMKTFRKTIKFNDTSGRYSVALPWKENKNDPPSNLNLSVKRLASLQRTLNNKRDPNLSANTTSNCRSSSKWDL